MHVGIVTSRYPPTFEGGGERSVQLLATSLLDSDQIEEVTVLSFDGEGVEERDGVTVERLSSVSPFLTEYQNIRAGIPLRSRLDAFDVVHAYNMELNPIVGYLASRRNLPSIATLNSYHFFPKSISSKSPGRLERLYELVGHRTTNPILVRSMKQIDQFTAPSEAMKQVYGIKGSL
jgi:starch synthase